MPYANPKDSNRWAMDNERALRLECIRKLGGRCVGCGETDKRVLQFNHKNGNGKDEISHRRYRMMKEIAEGKREGEFDLRCANCNIRYEYERGKLTDYMS